MILLRFLLIGLISGWILGKAIRGRGYGFFGNIFIGAIGSVFGWFVFAFLGLSATNFVGSIVAAVVGAVIFFFLMGLLKSGRKKEKEADR